MSMLARNEVSFSKKSSSSFHCKNVRVPLKLSKAILRPKVTLKALESDENSSILSGGKLRALADDTVAAAKKLGGNLTSYDAIDKTEKAVGQVKGVAQGLKERWGTLSAADRSAALALGVLVVLTQALVSFVIEVIEDLPFLGILLQAALVAATSAYLYAALKTPERRQKLKDFAAQSLERATGGRLRL